jgi:hypothetical protein
MVAAVGETSQSVKVWSLLVFVIRGGSKNPLRLRKNPCKLYRFS